MSHDCYISATDPAQRRLANSWDAGGNQRHVRTLAPDERLLEQDAKQPSQVDEHERDKLQGPHRQHGESPRLQPRGHSGQQSVEAAQLIATDVNPPTGSLLRGPGFRLGHAQGRGPLRLQVLPGVGGQEAPEAAGGDVRQGTPGEARVI